MEQKLYYLDWCPVRVLPITNGIAGSHSYRNPENEADSATPQTLPHKIKELFKKHGPSLLSIEFSIRFDGLFIFCIERIDGSYEGKIVARDVSNYIKLEFGHIHEFHTYPSFGKLGKFWVINALLEIYHIILVLWDWIVLSPIPHHKALDEKLIALPVDIEDPFSVGGLKTPKREFGSLEDVIQPNGYDDNLGQLRCRFNKNLRACIEIKHRYEKVKERGLEVLTYNRRHWSNSYSWRPIMYGVAVGIATFVGFYYAIQDESLYLLTDKVPQAMAMMAGFAIFIVADYKRQTPKLEIIQRIIGFYTYGNIFSRLVESIYSGSTGVIRFAYLNIHFDDTLKSLEARHDLEKQIIENRKYMWTTSFVVIAILLALLRIGIIDTNSLPMQ